MKKFLTVVIIFSLLFSALPLQVFSAQAKIVEVSGLKLFTNGKALKLNAAVLSINGVLLVPLKELLTGLGVPDQSKYIKWESKKKKAVINWKGISATFKTGSKSVIVNGKATDIGAMCISYSKNRKVYVPLKYTAQLFGSIIVTDDVVKSIYICDRSKYEKNMKLLKSIDEAMGKLVKQKVNTVMKLDLTSGENKLSINSDIADELDKQRGLLHSVANIPVLGRNLVFEMFYTDNTIYSRDTVNGNWNTTKLSEEDFNVLLNENTSLTSVNSMEVLAACMFDTVNPVPGKIVLKGCTYPKKLIEGITVDSGIEKLEPKVFNLEACVNCTTYLVEKLHIEISGSCIAAGGFTEAGTVVDIIYTEPDGSFEVRTPEW